MRVDDMLAEKLFNGVVLHNTDTDITYRMVDGVMQAKTTTHGWSDSKTTIEYLVERIDKLVEVTHDVVSGDYLYITKTLFKDTWGFNFRVGFTRGNEILGYTKDDNYSKFQTIDLSDDKTTYRKLSDDEINYIHVRKLFRDKGRKPYEYKVGDIVKEGMNIGEVVDVYGGVVEVDLIYGGRIVTNKEDVMIKFWVDDEVKIKLR